MKVKQSLSFDKDLLEQAKKQAIKERRSLSNLMDAALWAYLNPAPTIQRQKQRYETN